MGQFRVAFPTNHFDAATAFYRTHLAADTVTEWDDETRGVVLQVAGEGCVELFDAGPGTGAAPVGLIISIELHSTTAVDDLHSQLSLVAPVTTDLGDASWGHRTFRVMDPSGVTVAFWAPLPY